MQVTKVIITAPKENCEFYGWQRNAPHAVVPEEQKPVNGFIDAKGNNIYVFSPTRNRAVWVPAAHYEIQELTNV